MNEIWKYNIFNFPNDIHRFMYKLAHGGFDEDIVKDWIALLICVLIFWGGSALSIYVMYKLAIKYDSHSYLIVIATWFSFTSLNIITMVERPGLLYCDRVNVLTFINNLILGPITSFKIIALWFFLHTRISVCIPPCKYGNNKTSYLSRQSVKNWPESTSWLRTIKRWHENPPESIWPKCKKAAKITWKVANKRIEIV